MHDEPKLYCQYSKNIPLGRTQHLTFPKISRYMGEMIGTPKLLSTSNNIHIFSENYKILSSFTDYNFL
jgi:hypothetical protein